MFLFMVQFFDLYFFLYLFIDVNRISKSMKCDLNENFSSLNWKFVFAIKFWATIVIYRSKNIIYQSYILNKRMHAKGQYATDDIGATFLSFYFGFLNYSAWFPSILLYSVVRISQIHFTAFSCPTRIHVWDYAFA